MLSMAPWAIVYAVVKVCQRTSRRAIVRAEIDNDQVQLAAGQLILVLFSRVSTATAD